MKIIEIKTQVELDAYVDGDEFVELRIVAPQIVWIVVNKTYKNARVVARESSRVVARGSSRVVASGSSSVEAWGSSRVEARESSSVVAWGSSSVEAWGSSRVEAWGSSSVVARGSSRVVARESSRVVARESSSVEAWESSRVEAWGSSRVEAWENSMTNVISSSVVLKAHHFSISQIQDCDPKIEYFDKASILRTKTWLHDKKSFLDIYQDRGPNGGVILYKSVRPETRCDFYTGRIKYEGEVVCPDWNPDEKVECGGGFHLSPSPSLALSYNEGLVLKCEVMPEDFVVYGKDIKKMRCKRVTVLGEHK